MATTSYTAKTAPTKMYSHAVSYAAMLSAGSIRMAM